MELITTSRLRASRTCKRLHHYRYNLLRRPNKDAAPLRFGSIFHAGLEAWWLAWKAIHETDAGNLAAEYDAPLHAAKIAIKEAWMANDPGDGELDEFDLVRALQLMVGYDARWSSAMLDGSIEIVGAEVEFTGPLINPDSGRSSRTFLLAGKMDVIIRIVGGDAPGIYVVEHKTTSLDVSPGAAYWTKLRMDPQLSTYDRGARILGYDVRGFLYDVVRKPQQHPLKATPEETRRYTKGKRAKCCGKIDLAIVQAKECSVCLAAGRTGAAMGWADPPRLDARQRLVDETPEEFAERITESIVKDPEAFYARGDVVRLAEELAEHDRDTWIESKSIREAILANAHPRNPDACERYNRFCEYWSVCTGATAIDDDTFFRTSTAHQELSFGGDKVD